MSAETTMPGIRRTVGSYLLEEEIGRGGMGVVYRARRLDTGETVAVKLMLPEIAANSHFRARFVREASLGSDLDHPNIVPIYDAGDDDGDLFIAMRLVEGRDLKALVEEEGGLDPKRLVPIMRQVASALDAAHESGLVHHDVKPQNILLSEEDGPSTAYVTDFGLVRPAGSESTASRTGQVFGSIQYMAPEQVEGMPADGRADVYALGCVLYECLTGQIPFDRPNEVAVLWAHVHEAPPRVTDVRRDLPGGLDSLLATALAKHPDDRFLTCGELVEELEAALDRKHRPVVMPIVRPLVKRIPRAKTEREVWAPNYFPELSRVRRLTDRTNWVQVAAVASILCLLAAALVHFAHPRGFTGAVDDVATAVGNRVLDAGLALDSTFGGDEAETRPQRPVASGARSKGGSRRASEHVRLAAGQTDVSPPEGRPARFVPAAKGAVGSEPVGAAAAPAGKIVFDAPRMRWQGYSALYTMNPDGRGVRMLYNSDEPDSEPAWSPDGGRVAFVRGSTIYSIKADGTGEQRLSYGSGTDREPSWTPDGSAVLYAHADIGGRDWDIYRVDVSDTGIGVPTRLTSGPAADRDPEAAPTGESILFTRSEDDTDRLFTMNMDGSGIAQRTPSHLGGQQGEWDRDGSRIVFVDARGKMRLLGRDSSRAGDPIACPGWCYEPSFSPDGSSLLFGACRELCDEAAIFSLNLGAPRTMRKLESKVSRETEADWR